MFSKKSNSDTAQIDSLIGANLHIEGTVRFSGGLRIDGTVKGSVLADEHTKATLVVSKTGRVEGHVSADYVVVDGEITGEVKALHSLDLQSNARIQGDVSYRCLEVHSGACIQGKMLLLIAEEDVELSSSTSNVTYLESTMP